MSGATIQLYAVGTGGDGTAATPLISSTLTTGADGSFDLGGKYSCPDAASLVYIVASGGNPGLAPGTINSALDMMSVIGRCDSLTPSTFIVINEVTTVAAVSALSPFMTSPGNVGSGSDDASALATAFTSASAFVNTSTGSAPGVNVPEGTFVPTSKINSLADVVSGCINSSGGIAGDGSVCGTLFTLTTVPGYTPPADIITALNNVANNPTLNTSSLFNLAPSSAPFQPSLSSAPTDFSIQLLQTGDTGSSTSGSITLTPDSLTFYQTNVPQTVTMTNNGLTPVAIQTINIDANWSQTNNCGTTLQAQTVCTINVQSTSSTLGKFSGTMTVTDGDANNIQTVQLHTDNEALVGTLDFGSWSVGSSGNNRISAGVPQNGNTVLNGSISGSNPGDFSFADDWQGPFPAPFSCHGTGNSGSPCNLYVTFTPAAVGTRSALLVTNVGTYLLTGTGLPHGPNFSFDAGSYDFGSTALGSSNPLSLVISSNGDAPVTLLSPALGGLDSSDFAVTSTCTVLPAAVSGSVQSIGGGIYIAQAGVRSTCTLNVTFTPSASGPRSATLTESDNAGHQQTVTLTGNGTSTPPPTAPPTANPTSLSFGNVQIGQNASQSVTVTSANQPAVTAQISGSGDYTVLPATCAQGATTCTFNVTFSPSSTGPISGTLSLSSQGSPTNTSVPLTGSGIGTAGTGSSGSITMSPASLTFYQTNVPQTVTMTNTGQTPVTIQNINIDANWSQTNNCGTPLQAQSICTINVQSTNSTLGTFTGTLTITDGAANDIQTVQLTTDNEVLAGTIDFGTWPIGTTAAPPNDPSAIVLENVLTGNLTGSNPDVFTVYDQFAGQLSSPFDCTAIPGDPQNYCSLFILFKPSAVGTQSSLLVTNAGTYLLTGTGRPHGPHFYFPYTSSSFDFGSTSPGLPVPSNVYLLSDGDAQASLLPPVISGPNASDFTVTNNPCNAINPVPSSSVGKTSSTSLYSLHSTLMDCPITVTFNPSAIGPRTATLTLTDSAGLQQTQPLTGTSTSNSPLNPPPTVSMTSLSFGNVQLGVTATQNVTVISPNRAAVTAQIVGSANYTVQPGTCAQGALTCTLNVKFLPTSVGSITGTLYVTSAGSSGSTLVPLNGSGGESTVSLSTTSLNFGTNSIGTISLPQTVTLTNNGPAVLNVSNVAITAATPGEFIATSGNCAASIVLTAGQTCTLSVSFAPQTTGTRTGTLQIFSDAPTSPDTIQLSGVAQ